MEDFAKLFTSGAVRWRLPIGQQIYDMYRLARMGAMPWTYNGGHVYQEDLFWLLKCQELESQAPARSGGGEWKAVG